MRCGKAAGSSPLGLHHGRNPHECAVAKCTCAVVFALIAASQPARMRCGKVMRLAQRLQQTVSQPARMRCGKDCGVIVHTVNATSQPARMRCGKAPSGCRKLFAHWSQPARMRCGKIAPLLCPNRKPREHELRSSFLVSPSVILAVTFYMTAQLLKRFNTCTAKTAASKLSDAAVYSFNK